MFDNLKTLFESNHNMFAVYDGLNALNGKVSWDIDVRMNDEGYKTYCEQCCAFGNSINIEIDDNGQFRGEFTNFDGRKFTLVDISDNNGIQYHFEEAGTELYGKSTVIFSHPYNNTKFYMDYNKGKHRLDVDIFLRDNGDVGQINLESHSQEGSYEDFYKVDERAIVKCSNDENEVVYTIKHYGYGGDIIENNFFLQNELLMLELSRQQSVFDYDEIYAEDIPNALPIYNNAVDCFDNNGCLKTRSIYTEVPAQTAVNSPLKDYFPKFILHYENGEISFFENCKFDKNSLHTIHEFFNKEGELDHIDVTDAQHNFVGTFENRDAVNKTFKFEVLNDSAIRNEQYQKIKTIASRYRTDIEPEDIPPYMVMKNYYDIYSADNEAKITITDAETVKKVFDVLSQHKELLYGDWTFDTANEMNFLELYKLVTQPSFSLTEFVKANRDVQEIEGVGDDVLEGDEHHDITTDSTDTRNHNLE